jgi:uroporphyrinogen-III synthase
LVTRPAGQEESLCSALAAQGFRVFRQPMIIIEPLAELAPSQLQVVRDIDHFQHLVFVSSNAVTLGMAQIQDWWPQLPTDLCWYTVGAGSAALLSDFGVRAIHPPTEISSEGLLGLPGLQSLAGQRVLIIKGVGGRTLLQEALTARGARVEQLAVYRRRCPTLPAGQLAAHLEKNTVTTVLISSGEGLRNMVSLLGEAALTVLQQVTLVVPGQRVGGLAREIGANRVVEAADAGDDAMLNALQSVQQPERESL